jgi:hypothetical protein
MQQQKESPPSSAAVSPRTAGGVQSPLLRLTEIMDGLEAIVGEETALVRAGKLASARALGARKTELSILYFKAADELKAQRRSGGAARQDVSALADRHRQLHATLKANLMVLATAHAVSEGIVRRLSGDLARKSSPQVYGASGKTTAPDAKRSQPLALSRML